MPTPKSTIVFITTYPPRECGIATFTQDLFKNCQKNLGPDVRCKVAALNISAIETHKYPREVTWEIDQNSKRDYLRLAHDINTDPSIQGVILQHEYGIFGGASGEKILFFMHACTKPILVTLHTILPNPTPKMKEVTTEIINLSHAVVVLTKRSKEIIEEVYPTSRSKISIIPHGIHPVPFSDQQEFKDKLELSGHTVLSTFGLLGRRKGIEFVIDALPEIVHRYPKVLYLILGQTHPTTRRNEGEKYRLELEKRIKSLGLSKYVKFYDTYLSLHDVLEFLQATDIYISTSINPNQAVSGTLSYALGTGRAVVSTEFAQAKEIVTPAIGRLIPIKNPQALTSTLSELLSNPKILEGMHRAAYESTRHMLWQNVARAYVTVLTQTILPPLDLRHLIRMTDDIGLFRFAQNTTPIRESGYTLDDNARALIICSMLTREKSNKILMPLIQTYTSFMKRCQRPDGSFINYISKSGAETQQNRTETLEDTQARALWALGEIISNPKLPVALRSDATVSFNRLMAIIPKLTHARSQALAIKGIYLVRENLPGIKATGETIIRSCADALIKRIHDHTDGNWMWFEDTITYNNGILPESLLLAGEYLNEPQYTKKGIETLRFLIGHTFKEDMYIPIGNASWSHKKGIRSQYDQQPEDPASMILALATAYKMTRNEVYFQRASTCFSWFRGNNSAHHAVFNPQTGGCHDSLREDGVNNNQGAESLIAYLISHHTMRVFRASS